jgi:hypothetical protein
MSERESEKSVTRVDRDFGHLPWASIVFPLSHCKILLINTSCASCSNVLDHTTQHTAIRDPQAEAWNLAVIA